MGTELGLKAIKEARRRKLASLLETASKFELGKTLDMNPDYLWQMAKGSGKSARGISDKTARAIEVKLGKPTHWMEWDGDHPPAPVASQSAGLLYDNIADAIRLLELLAEVQGHNPPSVSPAEIFVAMEIVREEQVSLESAQVVDFQTRYLERILEVENTHGVERSKAERTREEAGRRAEQEPGEKKPATRRA
jgi:hypothetical protein